MRPPQPMDWDTRYEGLKKLTRPGFTPRAARVSTDPADSVRAREWSARPLGLLGETLMPAIEKYLAFFAVARGFEEA